MSADEADIRRLLLRYATLLDAGDLDGVAALFANATWQAGTATPLIGRDEVRRAYDRVVLYDGVPRTRHLITNVEIDVDLDESRHSRTASSTSYFTVMHAPPAQPLRPVLAGTYVDTFSREHVSHGAWRFASRIIHADLVGDIGTHYR